MRMDVPRALPAYAQAQVSCLLTLSTSTLPSWEGGGQAAGEGPRGHQRLTGGTGSLPWPCPKVAEATGAHQGSN